ncbi:hypothetical protein CDV31_000864 [Fusarium ambrosium]|uniref:Uncharacterized protein n=1 Tax=Fusarium ambrosium TaxID=131363 RepID=A0A428V1E6_9HYPO|nr:hypothetical protein CDV31_000864 [Fusarium ambrosium]
MATPALRTEKPPPPPPGTITHFPLQLSPSQKANNIEDEKKRTRVRSSASDIPKQALTPPARGLIPDPAHAAFTNGHRVTIRASRP